MGPHAFGCMLHDARPVSILAGVHSRLLSFQSSDLLAVGNRNKQACQKKTTPEFAVHPYHCRPGRLKDIHHVLCCFLSLSIQTHFASFLPHAQLGHSWATRSCGHALLLPSDCRQKRGPVRSRSACDSRPCVVFLLS